MSKKLDITSAVFVEKAPHVSKEIKEIAKDKIKELIAEETKLVKGIFINHECSGGSQTITIRKYPGVPLFTKTMRDGETYEIPLYVARFLNGTDVSVGAVDNPNKGSTLIGTCQYGVHGWKMDSQADFKPGVSSGDTVIPIVGITKRVKRFGFSSVDFGGGI